MTLQVAPAPNAQVASDRALTADRSERKYLIDGACVGGLLRSLASHLTPHRYTGEGENALPEALHYSTTIYFDTPSHALLRAARDNPGQNIKLRAREYYDLHSSLTELATDPDQIVRYRPHAWVELKRREGERTSKQRLRLEKRAVPAFLRALHSGQRPSPEGEPAAAMAALCAELGEPLVASALVNYRRLAFQDAAGDLRITLDSELSYYAPPADLFCRERALVRGSFGAPVGREALWLLEVKCRREAPAWLSATLSEAHAAPEAFSKFLRAGQVVHGG